MIKVMKVATAVGPKAAGAVAAAPSLTADAPPVIASTKATAAAAAAAAAAAESSQPKVRKYDKKFWTNLMVLLVSDLEY